MVVTVLYRMEGSPDVSALNMPFTDVAAGLWYSDAIKWAASKEIALGVGDGTFLPGQNVTREQMAAFIFRYSEFAKAGLPVKNEYKGFADQGDISTYAVDYVIALFQSDIIRGKDNNRFDPRGLANRAEFAAMLHRYLVTAIPGGAIETPDEAPVEETPADEPSPDGEVPDGEVPEEEEPAE